MSLQRVDRDRSAIPCRRPILLLSAFLIFLALNANPRAAAAGDEPEAKEEKKEPTLVERYDVLKDQVGTHLRKKDYEALDGDIGQVKQLYADAKQAEDKELPEKLVDLVGSMAKGGHARQTSTFVLDALADLQDPHGAKYVKPFLHQRDPEVFTVELEKAVAAAATVVDDSLVAPLLKLVESSKTYDLAADAVRALGRYGACKKKREQIIERLVRTVKKDKPGGRPRMRGPGTDDPTGASDGGSPMGRESGAGARYGALAPALVSALNMMTERSVSSPEEWFDTVDSLKGQLGSLFSE